MNWLWLISHDDALSDNDHVREDLKRHRLVLRLTALTILIFLLWASWAQIDQITRAPGSVIASSKTQIIQSEEAGSLEKLLVKEGDVVRRGDVLAQLDNTEALAGYREAKAKQYALLATLHRLEAEVFNKKLNFGAQFKDYPRFTNNQSQLYKKRQKALNEELGALDHMASLARKELSLNKPLLASGHVSETEVLRLERQLASSGRLAVHRNLEVGGIAGRNTQLNGSRQRGLQRCHPRRRIGLHFGVLLFRLFF